MQADFLRGIEVLDRGEVLVQESPTCEALVCHWFCQVQVSIKHAETETMHVRRDSAGVAGWKEVDGAWCSPGAGMPVPRPLLLLTSIPFA